MQADKDLPGQPVSKSIWREADPRLKVALTVLFILVCSLVREGKWAGLVLAAVSLWTATALARVSMRRMLARSLLALPFVFAALPLPFTLPGQIIAHLPVLGWPISQEGTVRLASVLARSWLSIQAAVLLVVTTPFPAIQWGLNGLGMPKLLVAVISLMYRYLFVLGEEAQRLQRARSARSASLPKGRSPGLVWRAQVTGNMVGSLFIRSLDRSERVYAAMLARGYRGEVRLLTHPAWRHTDSVLAARSALALAAILLTGVVF